MTALESLLIRHEGLRLKVYTDTKGKLSIGVGRNLDDVGITEEEALDLLDHDVTNCTRLAMDAFPGWFPSLGEARQAVVISMIFNMGLNRFLSFRNMIQACVQSDWNRAADEMLASSWAAEVKGRAVELAEIMRAGVLDAGAAHP